MNDSVVVLLGSKSLASFEKLSKRIRVNRDFKEAEAEENNNK